MRLRTGGEEYIEKDEMKEPRCSGENKRRGPSLWTDSRDCTDHESIKGIWNIK
jgi:hypothetical protein